MACPAAAIKRVTFAKEETVIYEPPELAEDLLKARQSNRIPVQDLCRMERRLAPVLEQRHRERMKILLGVQKSIYKEV